MAKELDNIQDKLNWHWRNSMRPVRFFAFDVRAASPIPVLLVYARLSTIIMTVLVMMFFRFLETKGLTVPAAMRSFRSWLVGKDRPGWLGIQKKRFVDFG